MGLRKVFRSTARWLGASTTYHVAAIYHMDSHIGASVIAMTCTMRPWLHAGNYRELVEFVESQATGAAETPSITSITKLGA